MTELTRQGKLLQTFAVLADTLVDDFDVVDMLQLLVDTCGEVFDVSAAGILLADNSNELELITSSSEASWLVESLQLSAEAGPCIESFRSGQSVSVDDLSKAPEEWAAFRDAAIAQGFASAHAFPLRLRERTIGTLNVFDDKEGPLHESDIVAAQALADVATIGILQERSLRQTAELAEQLQTALNRRVIIEQAKGVVAHTNNVGMDTAFALIRAYARSHQVSVSSVAARLVDMTLSLDGESLDS